MIVVVPCVTPVTSPADTVATPVADEVHVSVAVRSCVVPSVQVPTASSSIVRPAGTLGDGGDRAIDATRGRRRERRRNRSSWSSDRSP